MPKLYETGAQCVGCKFFATGSQVNCFENGATPAGNPAAGYIYVYSCSGTLASKNDAGTETVYGAGGGTSLWHDCGGTWICVCNNCQVCAQCIKGGLICGTTCIHGNRVCAVTCVHSACICGNNLIATGRVCTNRITHAGPFQFDLFSDDCVIPVINNSGCLGSSGTRWRCLYVSCGVSCSSDAAEKTNYCEINQDEILTAYKSIDVNTWEWKKAEGKRHIGPTAQDFNSKFDKFITIEDKKSISGTDHDGVQDAAIKALALCVGSLQKDIDKLKL